MNKDRKNEFLGYTWDQYTKVIIGLILLAIAVSIKVGVITAFRVVFGSVLTLFLPGFFLSHLFYKKKKIGAIERIALSFALSLSVTPFLIFFSTYLGIQISSMNTLIAILAISFITLIWLILKKEI